eukprot:6212909-Pleurochrysis_carterae.AAC.1
MQASCGNEVAWESVVHVKGHSRSADWRAQYRQECEMHETRIWEAAPRRARRYRGADRREEALVIHTHSSKYRG